MNELYDLEHKAYISFSGGKDSTVLSALIDLALPGNQIPRVYINTGIDYRAIVDFVRGYGKRDRRLQIIKPTQNIKIMLEKYGYPFKSKEHSQKVSYYQHSGMCKTVLDYLGQGNKKDFLCPEKLRYNFTPDFKIKVSDKCCKKLKKEPAEKWGKENNRPITITGIRQGEKGLRQSLSGCAVFYDDNCKELKKFHPLFPLSEKWIDEFIDRYNIELCNLYYPPYNFKRTGCKGCPYSLDLQNQLYIMSVYFPAERKQCELIWGKIYDEYRRIGYRLEPSLF
jgi:3'-phosphoadenosine 5'-phosphosulfate sulfotransferase (PAPS reductase)/FAD synthetase